MFQFDPILVDTLWTAAVTVLLLTSAGITLAMLPWTDEEIGEVNDAARALLLPARPPALGRATSRR